MVDGTVAEIGFDLEADGAETVDAAGLTMTPGLIDPHVHLRTPGDEDGERHRLGTRAAAAGSFVAILAMPDTDPVVDSGAVLERAVRPLPERLRTEEQLVTGPIHQREIWFLTGSQGLYGEDVLRQVADQSRQVVGRARRVRGRRRPGRVASRCSPTPARSGG